MTKFNIQERIDALKQQPVMEDMKKHFARTYDSLWEMDLRTVGGFIAENPKKAWREFVKREGTKKEFVKERMEQWNKHYGK